MARRLAGDLDGALADWSEVLEQDPTRAGALFGRGAARLDAGDREGAYEDLTAFLNAVPEDDPDAEAVRAAVDDLSTPA